MHDLQAIPVHYDMGDRYGNDADGDGRIEYDCSSAVSKALGIDMSNNTETLKTNLPKIGYNLIHDAVDGTFDPKRGDVVIWGPRDGSSSLGAFGHVMIFTSAGADAKVIHCNYGCDGITEDNYNYIWGLNGKPRETVYRESGSSTVTPTPSKPQPCNKAKVYKVDELKLANGIWQVRCNELVPCEFNWTDNGIACADITITDASGNRIADQVTKVGSYFTIEPSKVVNIGTGAYGSGNYYWRQVQLAASGWIWLSVWDKNHLLNG